ncbi:unnamed protein product, partial [Heterosigma akashiwo]
LDKLKENALEHKEMRGALHELRKNAEEHKEMREAMKDWKGQVEQAPSPPRSP